MTQRYSNNGVNFRYPDGWEIEEADTGDGPSVSVFPTEDDPIGAGYWSLARIPIEDGLTPQDVANEVVQALVDEYEDVDVYDPEDDEIGPYPTVGFDVDFLCLELSNSVRIRTFSALGDVILVMFQYCDVDADLLQSAFVDITNSLSCDLDT